MSFFICKIKWFFRNNFGWCPHCGKWFKKIRLFHMGTAYNEGYMNYMEGCSDCEKEVCKNVEEMWSEKDSSCY